MEKTKKKSTEEQFIADNILITDANETFFKLLEIGNKRGLNIVDISTKTGINKMTLYRYNSRYNSQKKTSPTLKLILKLCDLFGYEIRLHKTKKSDVEK